jgi:hypothetical protein
MGIALARDMDEDSGNIVKEHAETDRRCNPKDIRGSELKL